MNLNQLAKEICAREGLKKQVNIAQVKEVLRCLGDIINNKKTDRYAVIHAIETHYLDRAVAAFHKQTKQLEAKLNPKPKARAKKGNLK